MIPVQRSHWRFLMMAAVLTVAIFSARPAATHAQTFKPGNDEPLFRQATDAVWLCTKKGAGVLLAYKYTGDSNVNKTPDPFFVQSDAVSQDEKASSERVKAERLDFMKRAAAQYEICLGTDRKSKLSLVGEPVLRFNDNVTGAPDAALFVWTYQGRPEVAACIYLNARGVWVDEFQSLAQRELVAELNGRAVWYPSRPGVEFKPVPGAAPPANTASLRMSQMRIMARDFSASVVDRLSGRIELRLMPQPLYRYENPNAKLLDGAIFSFAKGTNPEVLLLLEALPVRTGHQWHYAVARMSARECEGRYNNEVIWSVSQAVYPIPREEPYLEVAIGRN